MHIIDVVRAVAEAVEQEEALGFYQREVTEIGARRGSIAGSFIISIGCGDGKIQHVITEQQIADAAFPIIPGRVRLMMAQLHAGVG